MLDTDAAARALMSHRNTPTQDTGIAPSVLLFGRPLRDHLPRLDRKLRPEWETIADAREMALAKRAIKVGPSEKRELKPLQLGDSVQIQNQTGNHPNKWFGTGVIAGVLPHRQYQVVKDGSRRVTLRNRRFLKKILPVSRKDFDLTPELSPVTTPGVTTEEPDRGDGGACVQPATVNTEEASTPAHQGERPQNVYRCDDETQGTPQDQIIPDETDIRPPEVFQPVRRSMRRAVPRKMFSAKLKGKTHE